jgi:ArsR family transcriptional regulator
MSKKKTLAPLTTEELDHLAGRFKLLGEPMRLKILQSVCHDPLTVNEIVKATGSTQANVSKHLTLLAAGGILKRKKDGQCVFYGVKDLLVLQLCELVRNQLNERPETGNETERVGSGMNGRRRS